MSDSLRKDADQIVARAIDAVKPDRAVQRALNGMEFPGRVYLVAVGKAAWQMACAALDCLQPPIEAGIVLTKHGHVSGQLPGVTCLEAGHPVPDSQSFIGTQAVLDLTENLTETDTVLFLLSGGGSALFEKPLVPPEELQDITRQLLASGADIVEMNTVRKRLSAVKGGRFAQWCAPARIHAVILSDILGDPLDMIASGPAAADPSTCAEAVAIVNKYSLNLSLQARRCMESETPKHLDNVTSVVIGSVGELCRAAANACRELGYEPIVLTDQLSCEAREAGRFMAAILGSYARAEFRTSTDEGAKLAFIAGGETVVRLMGKGLGGRNQELALAAAPELRGLEGVAIFSVGSDGTDGPTDAAGGYVDGTTWSRLTDRGIDVFDVLANNNANHALKAVDGLMITGPTGTNVNDVAVGLLRG